MIDLNRFSISFDTWSFKVRGQLFEFQRPLLMAILNVTPDSFFDGANYQTEEKISRRIDEVLASGANIIDIGAYSTRPGASYISEDEEWSRLKPALELAIKAKQNTHFFISIDTFRSGVADRSLEKGADMINDISAGAIDSQLWEVVSKHQVPYVLMHMQGTLDKKGVFYTTDYRDMLTDISIFFKKKIALLEEKNIYDVILDPGFGFGKTLDQNYDLVRNIELFHSMNLPILCGISRKSMIQNLFHITPKNALNATTALHMMLLLKGCKMLRVHDVLEARQAISVFEKSM